MGLIPRALQHGTQLMDPLSKKRHRTQFGGHRPQHTLCGFTWEAFSCKSPEGFRNPKCRLPQEGNESGCVCWPTQTSFRAGTYTGTSQTAATGGRSCSFSSGQNKDTHTPLSPTGLLRLSYCSSHSHTERKQAPGWPAPHTHSKVCLVTTHSERCILQTRKLRLEVELGQASTSLLGLGTKEKPKAQLVWELNVCCAESSQLISNESCRLLSNYYVPDTELSTLSPSHSRPTTTVPGRGRYRQLYFID